MSSSTRAATSVCASSANRPLCQALTPPIPIPVTATLVTASATTLVPMPQWAGEAQTGTIEVKRMSVLRESAQRSRPAVVPYLGRPRRSRARFPVIVTGQTCWCRYTSDAQMGPVLGVRAQVLGHRPGRMAGQPGDDVGDG